MLPVLSPPTSGEPQWCLGVGGRAPAAGLAGGWAQRASLGTVHRLRVQACVTLACGRPVTPLYSVHGESDALPEAKRCRICFGIDAA
eukprot:15463121-Alexandrium_andersonii.AAC.1